MPGYLPNWVGGALALLVAFLLELASGVVDTAFVDHDDPQVGRVATLAQDANRP